MKLDQIDHIIVREAGGRTMRAFVADAPEESGPKPALILLHEIFGLNASIRETAMLFAEEGYLVVAPDLFWRAEEGVDLGYGQEDTARAMQLYGGYDPLAGLADISLAIEAARALPNCNGSVVVLGYCLGGTLAVLASTLGSVSACVAYYPVALEAIDLPGEPACPIVMHFGGADPFAPPEAVHALRARFAGRKVRIFEYPGASHAFYNRARAEYSDLQAKASHTRSLELLRKQVGPEYDLEALWEQHVLFEFGMKDADSTIATMVDEPYVNHVPTLTGGVGRKQLRHFYASYFVDVHPDDFDITIVSRTVGVDRLVDEMVTTFTHDRMMDYLLPGIAPTGRKVKMAAVGIICFRGGKLFHEHIHYDMGTLLAQVGLLDPATLPIAGPEAAEKVLDRYSHPSNGKMTTWSEP